MVSFIMWSDGDMDKQRDQKEPCKSHGDKAMLHIALILTAHKQDDYASLEGISQDASLPKPCNPKNVLSHQFIIYSIITVYLLKSSNTRVSATIVADRVVICGNQEGRSAQHS